jgi:hypothetical protein
MNGSRCIHGIPLDARCSECATAGRADHVLGSLELRPDPAALVVRALADTVEAAAIQTAAYLRLVDAARAAVAEYQADPPRWLVLDDAMTRLREALPK